MIAGTGRRGTWTGALLLPLFVSTGTVLAQSQDGKTGSPFDQLDPSQIPDYEQGVAAARLGGELPEGLVAVIGDSRLRHGAYVSSIVASPDGRWCVTGGGQSLVMWDLETGEAIRQMPDASGYRIFSLDLSRDGKTLIAGGANNAVTIWDMPEGRLRHRLDTMGAWVALTRDGSRLATGDIGLPELNIWDARSGERVRSIDLRTVAPTLFENAGIAAVDVAFSNDGSLLATALPVMQPDGNSRSTRLVLWNAESGEPVRVLGGHDHQEMRGLEFSPDDRWLASCAPDGHVKLWDVDSGELEWDFATVGDRWVQGLEFAHDGDSVFVLIEDELHEIDVATGKGAAPVRLPFRAACFSLMPDQRRALIATWVVKLIDLNTGELQPITTNPLTNRVNGIAIRPDDRQLATVGDGGQVRLWDVKSGNLRQELKGHDADVKAVAWHPQGRFLVTADDDGRIIFWDADTGAKSDQLNGPIQPHVIALSANGQQLAISNYNREVDLWDLAIQRHVRTLTGAFGYSEEALGFLPDGLRLISGGGIWELGTGKLVRPFFSSDRFWAVSRDGTRMLVNDRLTDFETGDEIATLAGHWQLQSAAFSPDNKWLATLGRGGMLGLWDQKTGTSRRFLKVVPRDTFVGPVAWSNDSRHVAFPSGNGTVYIMRVIPREGRESGQ